MQRPDDDKSLVRTESGLQLIFLTGLSGAGKSTAMHALEDHYLAALDRPAHGREKN